MMKSTYYTAVRWS